MSDSQHKQHIAQQCSTVVLSVIMLSVPFFTTMVSVVMLNVVILSVVAPEKILILMKEGIF